MSTVGVIVNPHAGKDIRRLVSAAGHTSDTVKIGIVRRVVAGAVEAGATKVLVSADTHRLGARAVVGIDGDIEIVDGPMTSSHLDTVTAAQEMWKRQVGALVVLGGDGTCRDVAGAWPDATMIAISTGTNNVFPAAVDGTTAGVAAGLVASGVVAADAVASPAKRVNVRIEEPGVPPIEQIALVEVALVASSFVGARAVTDPNSIRWVVACIAEPSGTGLSSIAGRVRPVRRSEAGGVVVELGPGNRAVRVPLAPGTFATLGVRDSRHLEEGQAITLPGGGVLAYDGERTTTVSAAARVDISVERSGPAMIDIDRTLHLAATARLFDVPRSSRKDHHGD